MAQATYDSGPHRGKSIPGMMKVGNIDVNHRPGIKNDDGSASSIFSMTIPVNKDGSVWKGDYEKAPAYALVPSIANGRFLTPDGKIPPLADRRDSELTPSQRREKKQQIGALEDATTKYYDKTREHLGIFSSGDAADKYADSTHAYVNDGTDKKVYAPSYDGDNNLSPTAFKDGNNMPAPAATPSASTDFQYIKLPDGSYGKFRADASDDEIRGHIQKDFPDAFKAPAKPGAASRFASSAADASPLAMLTHPGDTIRALSHAGNPYDPENPIAQQIGSTVEEARQAWQNARSGNTAGAVSHAISAIPVLGSALDKATDAAANNGMGKPGNSYAQDLGKVITSPEAMGTLTGTAATLAAPARNAVIKAGGGGALEAAGDAIGNTSKALRIPDNIATNLPQKLPGALRQARDRFTQSAFPKNMSLTPQEEAAQELIKALNPPVGPNGKIPENVESSASEAAHVRAYAQRKGLPINGKLDFSKAADAAGDEVQSHFDDVLRQPHNGKFQNVPNSYQGEMSGNGTNQASIGQINDRINTIRRRLNAKSKPTTQDDFALEAEARDLTQVLHKGLADMNGMTPEEVAAVRQRAGKLRTLAEQARMSAARDSAAAASRESGKSGAGANLLRPIDAAADAIGGGPEVIGNRTLKGALDRFTPQETPLPKPASQPSGVPTTPEAAQAEFLRAHQLEQASQEAAAARNVEANRLRAQNVNTQRQAAQAQATDMLQSEQTAQDLAAARNKFANSRRTANVDAQKSMAEQEVIRAHELEQAAQDASAGRSQVASQARAGNVAADQAAQDAQAAANQAAAQQEVVHSIGLQQAAEDASAERAAMAKDARAQNAAADQASKLDEGAAVRETGRRRVAAAQNPPPAAPSAPKTAPVATAQASPVPTEPASTPPPPAPSGDPNSFILNDDGSLGMIGQDGKPAVTPAASTPALQEAQPHPDTHVFSKSALLRSDPTADVEAAAKDAAAQGYEVQN